MALYRSGPVLVETLGADSVQAGYLNLALGLFLLAYVTLSQFAQGLIPALSGLRARGRPEQGRAWLSNFVRVGWLLGWLSAAGVWLAADWATPLVFGPAFQPAAAALKWISLGLPVAALLWAGNVAATVAGRGRVKFGASLAALLSFLAAGLLLIPAYGAAGAALALVLAVAAHVAVLSLALQPEFRLEWAALWPGGTAGGLGLLLVLWLGG